MEYAKSRRGPASAPINRGNASCPTQYLVGRGDRPPLGQLALRAGQRVPHLLVAAEQRHRCAQEYEAKINSGDPLAIAEVVRDLHRNVGQPDQSFSERQIYESAMDRLAAELAALDQTDKMTAVTKLIEFLKTV